MLEEQDQLGDGDADGDTPLPPVDILDSSDEEGSSTKSLDPPNTNLSVAPIAPVSVISNCAAVVVDVSNTKKSVHSVAVSPSLDQIKPSAMEGVATATYSGSPPTGYFAVKNSNKSSNAVYNLHTGGSAPLTDTRSNGSFFAPGDSRENICVVKVDLAKKIISCSSFDIVKG